LAKLLFLSPFLHDFAWSPLPYSRTHTCGCIMSAWMRVEHSCMHIFAGVELHTQTHAVSAPTRMYSMLGFFPGCCAHVLNLSCMQIVRWRLLCTSRISIQKTLTSALFQFLCMHPEHHMPVTHTLYVCVAHKMQGCLLAFTRTDCSNKDHIHAQKEVMQTLSTCMLACSLARMHTYLRARAHTHTRDVYVQRPIEHTQQRSKLGAATC
jgi:hypothetical protein